LCNAGGYPTLTDCTFILNYASDGGAIYTGEGPLVGGGSANLTNCIFSGNSAIEYGGALLAFSRYSTLTMANCTFSANTAEYGAGMSIGLGIPPMTVAEREFSVNTTTFTEGGEIRLETGLPTLLTNCIFWGNSDSNGVDESAQIQCYTDVNITIAYSCIQNCSTYCSDANDMNIALDPLFIRNPNDGGDGWIDDPNTPEDETANNDYGDLRLTDSSPCIDTGNNDADTEVTTPEIDPLPDSDLDGRPRFTDGDCNGTEIGRLRRRL
jgi:predicted outer membrane repeat protein